jgi:hypothetical protein
MVFMIKATLGKVALRPSVTQNGQAFLRLADKLDVTTPGLAKADLAKTVPPPSARFVARQPILTKDEKVFGYELLFRDGVESYFCPTDPEAASRSTLDTSLLMGLDVLCDGRRAFINCTREMLLKDYITLLPSSQAVVEILESVEPDELVEQPASA